MGGVRVSSPRLIGREAELDALTGFVAGLREGSPGVALVSGRAGSGKTRLVTEFVSGLSSTRARVLSGSCPPLELGGPPYDPLLSALHSGLPDDAPVLAALTGARQVSRLQLFELLRLAVDGLSRRERLLMVMEDVHWADRATQQALHYLLAQATGGRWGLLATARPEGASLSATLGSRPVLRLTLGTLSVDQVGEQVAAITGERPSADVAALTHRRSGGIPLLVEEVVAAGTDQVPDHLRALFVARVKVLGDTVADVVNVAAVIDRGCDEEVVAQVLGADVRTVREAARRAVEADLLTVDQQGYRVRHELLREAVYDDLPPALRRDLHARAARVLSRLADVEPAELAHQWHRGGRPEETARASLDAAAVAERAHAPAAEHAQLERVLALWPRLSDDLRARAGGRAEILRRAAAAAERDGEFATAAALIEELLAIEADDALAWERLARYRWQAGDGPGSQAAYAKAVELLPPDALPDVRAKVLSGQAWFLGASYQTERAMQVSQQALTASSGIHDRSVRWQVLLSWGIARPDSEEGLHALDEARALAVSLDAGYDVAITDLWRNVSLRRLGRLSECESALRGGLRYVAAHGLGRSVEAALYYMLAERLLELGRWDEAAAALEANRGRQVGGIPAYFTSSYRARLAAFRGEGKVAAEAIAETLNRATEIPQQPLPHAIALLAEVEQGLWSGAPDRAVASAVEALRLSEGDIECAADALAVLTRAEADAADQCRLHGRRYTPVVAADDLLRRAREGDLPAHARVHAFTLEVQAEADRMNGAREPASWRTAVEAWTVAADPYRAAYARWRLGWALLHSRSGRAEATRELRSAHQAATMLGASPLRVAIEELVAAARLQVGTSPAAGVAADLGLTGRELEVLPLLAAGRTNAEIADLLVISPRTVGVHVSQILHKLGASRRTEAADLARRAGLLDH